MQESFVTKLNRCIRLGGSLFFEALPFPTGAFSIQASEHHYSTPRENLDAADYVEWEVDIIVDGQLVRPSKVSEELSRFDEYFEGGSSPVAGYVPTAVVQDLYDEILRVTNK